MISDRDLELADKGDADGFVRTGLDTSRRLTDRKTTAAQIAFADDAFLSVILGHVVGTFQNAVLAANALIVQMPDNAGDPVLFIGVDRTTVQAGWIDTVMAGGGDKSLAWFLRSASMKQPDGPPRFIVIQPI